MDTLRYILLANGLLIVGSISYYVFTSLAAFTHPASDVTTATGMYDTTQKKSTSPTLLIYTDDDK